MSGGGPWRRHVALPADHGAWTFLLVPLAIGLVAGARVRPGSACLAIAALAGFLLRQPTTHLVKIASGRRSRDDLPAALAWISAWCALAAPALAGLVWLGHGVVLLLALPGLPVYAWYLVLVARRSERGQELLDVAGAGVLALTAPAALWIARGRPDAAGWLLWGLCWGQSAMAITCVSARLAQRRAHGAGAATLARLALPALATNLAVLIAVAGLAVARLVPGWLVLAYALQGGETAWHAWRPAPRTRPRAIGMRQLAVTVTFAVLFLLAW